MLVSKTLKRTGVLLATLAMIGVLFVPGGSAQEFQPTVTADTPGVSPKTIFPETETGTLSIPVTYRMPPGTQLSFFSGPGIPVSVSFSNCPSYVSITGASSKVFAYPDPQTPDPSTQETFSLDVTIGRDAPGLQSITCTANIDAEAVGNGQIQAASDSVQFTVRADYYSLLQAKVSQKVQQAGPYKEVPFDIELTNFGNARTQVAFEVTERPSGGKWSVSVPENIILNSPNSGTGSPQDVATLTVVTTYKNGWNNEQGAYTLQLNPTSADDPSKTGNTISTNMLVRVRGVYVPGFEPIVMLGAVIGVGLMARMRSDDE
jgi:hypothetical protein